MRDVRFSRYRFQVPEDWMQSSAGNSHELAFGTTDGRLGVSMMLVPRRHLAGYLRTRSMNPLPGTPARLGEVRVANRVINGLPVEVSHGVIHYDGGKTYEVRFWVFRGKDTALVVNAFDGVKLHNREIDAVVRSVRHASRLVSPSGRPDFWAAMPAVARRLVGARTTD